MHMSLTKKYKWNNQPPRTNNSHTKIHFNLHQHIPRMKSQLSVNNQIAIASWTDEHESRQRKDGRADIG